MNTRRLGYAFASMTLIATFSGCTSGGAATPTDISSFPSPTAAANALAGQWDLQSLQGTDISKLLPSGGKAPNLVIAQDGKVSGFGGVNRLMSPLDMNALTQGKFQLGQIASTKMAGSPEAMNLESSFTNLLSQVKAFNLSGNTLRLKNDSGATLMELVKAAAN